MTEKIQCGSRHFVGYQQSEVPAVVADVVRQLALHRFILSARIERGSVAGYDVVDLGEDACSRAVLSSPKIRRDAEAFLDAARGRFIRETTAQLRQVLRAA